MLMDEEVKIFLEILKFVKNYQRFLSKNAENRMKSTLFNKLTLCWIGQDRQLW